MKEGRPATRCTFPSKIRQIVERDFLAVSLILFSSKLSVKRINPMENFAMFELVSRTSSFPYLNLKRSKVRVTLRERFCGKDLSQ